jgi:trigger factor
MKSSVKKLKDCKVKLSVEVEPQLVERHFREALEQFQRAAQIHGFREGKAPLDLVERKFAKEIEEEVLKSLVPEAYHKAIVDQKLSPVSMPSISEIHLERAKKLSFSAEFDEAPQFSLKNYKGIKLRKVPSEVHPEDVEKSLSSLLDSRAELVPLVEARAVQKGDFIAADIEVWRDGPAQGGQYVPSKKGALLFVEPNPQDDFYDKVLGAQVDEVREISVELTEDEKKQGLVGRKPFYKIWIRGIQQKKLPALDEAFAKSFGKESVEELKEAVHKDLTAYKRSESRDKMKRELFEKLSEMVSFPLPESLIARQKERLIEDTRRAYERVGMTAAQFEAQKDKWDPQADTKAKEQVKVYFILQKVADQENIEADELEVERRLQAIGEESKRPMEEVRRVFEEDVRESLREAQTIEFLLANAKWEE